MLAVTVRVRSLILASVVSFLHQVGSFAAPLGLRAAVLAGVCSSGSSHRSRGRLPCTIMEEQEAVVSLVLSGDNVYFQEASRQSLGKSVVMRMLHKEQSC